MTTELIDCRFAEVDQWPTISAVEAMLEGHMAALAAIRSQSEMIAAVADGRVLAGDVSRAIPRRRLHRALAECVSYIGRPLPRSSIMQQLMLTAKTTLLPGMHIKINQHTYDTHRKKDLHYDPRLDDRRQPVCYSVMMPKRAAKIPR